MIFTNGLVFRAAITVVAVSCSSFGYASTVMRQHDDVSHSGGAYFTCDASIPTRLCCVDKVDSDGSVTGCRISQDIILGRGDQSPLSASAVNVCDSHHEGEEFPFAVCCGSKDKDNAEDGTYRGRDCISASFVAVHRRQAESVDDMPLRRAQLPSALELLGLPTPKKIRVRNAAMRASQTPKKSTRATEKLQMADPAQRVRPRADKRAAGFTFEDATRVLGLPTAKKARTGTPRKAASKRTVDQEPRAGDPTKPAMMNARNSEPLVDFDSQAEILDKQALKGPAMTRRSVDSEPQAGDTDKPALGGDGPSAAQRVGLPSVKKDVDAQGEEGLSFTRRSRQVNAVMKEVRGQQVNVKAPRWIPTNGFMFVG